ncbi:hypothetical protein IW262DRAFT_1412100 [Armillaria fumosa]|nr:hypothetical protein IW262DRAFT_1412100 [Armillaria fumosa]
MAEHAMTVEEVKRSTLMVAPLHLRVLLDDAREMIVGKSSFTSWEALWRSFGDDHHLTPAYVQGIAPALTLEACRLICFTTDVRLHGNQSAHTASPADVRSAILQRSFGNERSMLQQIFRVVYDQQI